MDFFALFRRRTHLNRNSSTQFINFPLFTTQFMKIRAVMFFKNFICYKSSVQFLKILKLSQSSSICEKNSYSKICDFTPSDVKKRFVFFFVAPLKLLLIKLTNFRLGRQAVMLTADSKLHKRFSSKFKRFTLRKRLVGHSRRKIDRRLKARLRFMTQLMFFQSNSLIWLRDRSSVP